jgi:predicted lactoylglutathione lyase
MSLELSMVGLVVTDMAASLAFYRHLGIELPPEDDGKRFVMKRMESGVTIFWDHYFVEKYDPEREPPRGGARVLLEFFLADNAAVDAKYAEMTGYGYHGRKTPGQTDGPYAAIVDDPDGNMILLTAG